MATDDVNRKIVRNTMSNYARLGLRMVLGVCTFRLLYQELTPEEFGFMAFLWSVFGLGALLDFGFGLTVQKQVAQLSARGQWQELSCVLSTIFILYSAIAVAIAVAGYVCAPLLVSTLDVSAANRDSFRITAALFIFGVGLSFPLGIFPEILRGQQNIHTTNSLVMLGLLINFVLVICAVTWHWSLTIIIMNSLITVLAPSAAAAYVGLQRMPQVSLRLRWFRTRLLRETAQFSLSAYIIVVTYLILSKTDQIVIGTLSSVAAVALYQPGAKIGALFGTASRQLAGALQPAAAHFHGLRDQNRLRTLLVRGTKYSVMLSTPLYLGCAFLMTPLLLVITGESEIDPATWWTAQALVLWAYGFIITHNVYKRIAVMSGQESRLLRAGIAEAVMNLGLSIGLLWWLESVAAVALATLLSSMCCGWLWLWRWAVADAGMSGFAYARVVLWTSWRACLPLLAWLMLTVLNPWLPVYDSVALCLSVIMISAVLAIVGIWRWALDSEERDWIGQRLRPVAARFPLLRTFLKR